MSWNQDPESYECFLARAKQSQNQRKYQLAAPHNPNPGYAIVHPEHGATLLIREIDNMSEDEVLNIFLPTFKDDITGIRLFPPIPGTRGFAFIDFKEPLAAIRAFTVKHRGSFMYKGVSKQINLSRITKGTTTDTETKWTKYQERLKHNSGHGHLDSTPRRLFLNSADGSQPQSDRDRDKVVFNEPVATIPFEAVAKGSQLSERNRDRASESTSRSDRDPPRSSAARESERRASPDRERRQDKHEDDSRRSSRDDDRQRSDRDDRGHGDRDRRNGGDDRFDRKRDRGADDRHDRKRERYDDDDDSRRTQRRF